MGKAHSTEAKGNGDHANKTLSPSSGGTQGLAWAAESAEFSLTKKPTQSQDGNGPVQQHATNDGTHNTSPPSSAGHKKGPSDKDASEATTRSNDKTRSGSEDRLSTTQPASSYEEQYVNETTQEDAASGDSPYKAYIPVGAVCVNGVEHRDDWATYAANLLDASGSRTFGIRGLRTFNGRFALFTRQKHDSEDDTLQKTKQYTLVQVLPDDRIRIAKGEIRTVPFDAVWIKVTDTLYDSAGAAATACVSGVQAKYLTLVPSWQQNALDKWVKSPALQEAHLQGRQPKTAVSLVDPQSARDGAAVYQNVYGGGTASESGSTSLGVYAIDVGAGCFAIDDPAFPGKCRLLLRMDAERAAFSLTKSAKRRIMDALEAQKV